MHLKQKNKEIPTNLKTNQGISKNLLIFKFVTFHNKNSNHTKFNDSILSLF